MLRPAVEGALPPAGDATAAATAARGGGDHAGHSADQMLLDVLQEGIRGVATRGLDGWKDGDVSKMSRQNRILTGARTTVAPDVVERALN